MAVRTRIPTLSRVGLFAAAIIVGVGVGTVLSQDPIGAPVIGSVPAVVAGGFAILVGGGLYLGIRRSDRSDCGCSSDCDCP